MVEAAGLVVTGLHWLLVKPSGLSVTDPDPARRRRTLDVVTRLIGLCAELGGKVLVHGSPKQREVAAGETLDIARARLRDFLAEAAEAAAAHGVVYCIEPLSRNETLLVNTVAEAAEIVRAVGPAVAPDDDRLQRRGPERIGLGARADRRAGCRPASIGHVQVNDPNRRAPGQGEMRFAPIFAALKRQGYDGTVAVEPFDYVPDGPGCAAYAAGYLRGVRESLP